MCAKARLKKSRRMGCRGFVFRGCGARCQSIEAPVIFAQMPFFIGNEKTLSPPKLEERL
jgi:hypothetical protein